jgi:hypothetical protein
MLFSERGRGVSPATVRLWFHRLSTSLEGSYWMPGSYFAMLSENLNSWLSPLKNTEFKEEEGRRHRVLRPPPIDDPGIQQEPRGQGEPGAEEALVLVSHSRLSFGATRVSAYGRV